MAGYSVRSIAELSKQARGNFTSAIQGAVASVWANTFTVVGKVMALLDFEHEQRRAWLFRQQFASTADEVWLARHGFELGLTRSAGSKALGVITVPATPGTLAPSGLQYLRGDGVTYTTLAGASTVGASIDLFVEADAAGALGNAQSGTALTLVDIGSVPSGMEASAVVAGDGLGAGTDAEALEAFRARVLARRRNPPQGGSALDYQAWAGEALDVVTAVYVNSFENDIRSIGVQFTVSDQLDGIPSPQQVQVVQAYLDDPIRRPVTARVFVSAPRPMPVPILIRGLTPDTPDIRSSIAAELGAVFTDRARPGSPTADFRLYRSWIEEAIGRAVGEDGHDLVTPSADQTFGSGYYPVLGAINYSD